MKERIQQLIKHLTEGLIEREEAVKLTLLSALAGESIFLYGPPGVGKSLIARRLKYAFSDGKSFEYLMTKFSTPEEIFGPISIKKLKEEDKYERLTDEYLPGANVVFLDEIWKSGPAIQNALLTILNERIYRNGTQETKVDLHAIIAASNELPPDGESYGPLWDRFLIRYQVQPVKKTEAFFQLISGNQDLYQDNIPPDLKISIDELRQWSQMADEVEIPNEVSTAIRVIYEKLQEANNRQTELPPFQIYDRRWKKVVRLMKVSAMCHGRTAIHLSDVYLAVHCLWNHTSQIPVLRKIVSDTIREHGYNIALKLSLLTAEIQRYESEILSETRIKITELTDAPRTVRDAYFPLEKCDDLPTATYVKVTDYKTLLPADFQVINFYDSDFKIVYRLQSALGSKPYTLKILHNNRTIAIDIQTVKQEVSRLVYKKPHPLVKAYWDEWGEKLENFVEERSEWLKKNVPYQLTNYADHLFVDDSIATLVAENFEKTVFRIDQLKLRLEKARFLYSSDKAAEKVI